MKKIKILLGTVTGNARNVAQNIVETCQDPLGNVELIENAQLEDLQNTEADECVLICSSTTGAGGLPKGLTPLYLTLRDNPTNLHGLNYAIIGLGDSVFRDTFCGGVKKLDTLLTRYGGQRIGNALLIDTPVHKNYVTLSTDWLYALFREEP